MEFKKKLLEPALTLLKSLSGTEDVKIVMPSYNNVFSFYSPSGGTGISTFVANTAYVLSTQVKVAVVDMDLFHPCLFRFFLTEGNGNTGMHPQADLVDKLITAAANLPTFAHSTKFSNIVLFTGMPQNDVLKFCELDYSNIIQFIREVSKLYDYVLIDFKGSFTQETVLATIEASTQVFTFIRPLVSDADAVYKDNALLSRYGYGKKLNSIIQSGVKEVHLPHDMFDEGVVDLMHIPYVSEVEDAGTNFDVFYATDAGSSKAGRTYADCCKFMAEYIVNYEQLTVKGEG